MSGATTSGKVVVRTPAGNATSSADLFIPPAPWLAADIVGTGRVAAGGSQTVTIGTANKAGLLLFDGTAGQRISLTMTATYNWTWLAIYNPDGSGLITGQTLWGGGGGFIDVKTLPATGTYTILLDPDATSTGNVTVNLFTVPADVTNTITAGGSAVVVTTTTPGQNANLTFSGTTGQRVSVKMTNSNFPNTCGWLGILKPDGTTLAYHDCMLPAGDFIDVQTLPSTGTYSIRIDPGGPGIGSMTFTLYDVPANVSGTMTLGTGFSVNVTTPGQDVGLTFSGTSGNRLSFQLSNGSFPNQCQWIGIYKPDSTLLESESCMLPGGLFFDSVTLPATGTYSVGIDMKNGATGTYTLTAYDVPADIAPTLTLGGSAYWVNMTVPGQNAEPTFSATSGQRVRVQVWDKNFPWSCSWLSIKNPAGSHIASESCLLPGGTTTLDSPTLTTTGTHSIRIDLPGANTGSMNVVITLLSSSLLEQLAEESPVLAAVPVGATEGQSGELATLSLTDDGEDPPLVAASLQQFTPVATPPGGQPTATPIRTASPTATASVTPTLARSATPGPTGQPNPLTPTPQPFFGSGTPGPTVRPSPEAPSRLDHRGGPDEEWVPDARNLKGDFTLRRGESRQESPYERFTLPEAGRGETALAGRALKLNGEPLQGVTLRIKDQATTTDEGGRFLLEKLDAGHQVLVTDGSTVNQPGRSYGIFHAGVDIEAGKTNVLPYTIWMPIIDTANRQRITSPTSQEVVVTNPRLPGLELHIPSGATITGADGRLVTDIGLTAMPLDRPAFAVPTGVGFPVYFTIQPGGAYVSGGGAYLVYPNYSEETPGTRMNFWHYDPNGRGWYVYGKGTVTPDGRQIVPDPGVRIYEFTGAMVAVDNIGPDSGQAPGGGSESGDPVDLSTGLFIMTKADLALGGLMPISLNRTYRQLDTRSRAFDIGSNHPYDIFLVGDTSPYTYHRPHSARWRKGSLHQNLIRNGLHRRGLRAHVKPNGLLQVGHLMGCRQLWLEAHDKGRHGVHVPRRVFSHAIAAGGG